MKCRRCNGEGYETYEEDGRMITDSCYHCGETGEVDEDMDWHDRLMNVATTLAVQAETEYRMWRNADPEGEGYDFCAAENGMTGWDYFKCRVWSLTDQYSQRLAEMPLSDQELLVAWNEQPPTVMPMPSEDMQALLVSCNKAEQCGIGDDDIPF